MAGWVLLSFAAFDSVCAMLAACLHDIANGGTTVSTLRLGLRQLHAPISCSGIPLAFCITVVYRPHLACTLLTYACGLACGTERFGISVSCQVWLPTPSRLEPPLPPCPTAYSCCKTSAHPRASSTCHDTKRLVVPCHSSVLRWHHSGVMSHVLAPWTHLMSPQRAELHLQSLTWSRQLVAMVQHRSHSHSESSQLGRDE
ncbi:hypothetical protein JKP88DRAFT_251578 [Tribonema minus]|uniref:Secreted protein n=1 Tax=Tribonema minus TaxID=303371 RepID=A0A836CQ11_9STRA|nr:hypothetical protein JKP88DRAFT_251578 [Tribonema minus]